MPNLFRRPTNRKRTGAAAALMLGTCFLSFTPANASSITRIGPEQVAAQSLEDRIGGSASSQTVRRASVSPAACAREFHPKLTGIAEGPFQRIKAAITSPVAGSAGAGDASGNGLIFGPPTRSRSAAEASAVRAAVAAARSNGAVPAPVLDANARWTAQRIREDLGDFLAQGPSPYLCAGIDNYLETLREYAGRIGTSPERRERDLETARLMAKSSLDAALAALRPVPLPTPAPSDRPDPSIVADTLRKTIGVKDHEVMGPPMLVAGREDGSVQVSASGSADPDLPPLKARADRSFRSEADVVAALDEIDSAIERQNGVSATLDHTSTGSIGAMMGPMRPVIGPMPQAEQPTPLQKLSRMKPVVEPVATFNGDARTQALVFAALSDLEIVDHLLIASKSPADPLSQAFADTFKAIETAHAESCGCK